MLSNFLKEFRLYCEKVPKGFEKYYKKPGQAAAAAEKDGTKTEPSKGEPAKQSTAGKDAAPREKPKDWNLGMFNPTASGRGGSGSGGQGRPIGSGEPERDKMLLIGALAGIGCVIALAYFEMGYKEISWKDFVNK